MISAQLQGNLGNQLWQYAVCRGVAERLGVPFHIPRAFQGHTLFPALSLGEPQEDIETVFYENGHWHVQQYDPRVLRGDVIKDGTRLVGLFQSERYLWDIGRERLSQWFSTEGLPNTEHLTTLANTCIINFRGGDYVGKSEVFLPKTYFQRAVEYVKRVDSGVKFVVVTDDEKTARTFFPNYPIVTPGPALSFALVSHAPYLIIANSSFSWWASWLNDTARVVVAPRYWLRYNVSTGWWSPSDSLTMRFTYIDPKTGRAVSALECASAIDPATNYLTNYYA